MIERASYGQILKSSSIMGGASGICMLIGLVQTKVAAVLVGTIGLGLLANFRAIQNTIGTFAGLGIESSAVRDVASALAKNNDLVIGRTILSLRRICILTGLAGAFVLLLLSPLISQWTFNSEKYTADIAALSLVLLFTSLSSGQMAQIRGLRRIEAIARINILSALSGAIITIGLYYWLGTRGIVPALVLSAAMKLLFLWRASHGLIIPVVTMTWIESIRESAAMVKLGFSFMWAALAASFTVYITVTLIMHQEGLEAVGIYSAAFVLSGQSVNFLRGAMTMDYYPRLSGLAHDMDATNRLVNEQIEIAMLLGVPGLLAMMSLAPWLIHMIYTSAFLPASDLLQWYTLGCLVSLIVWPIAFLLQSLGKSGWFFFSETLFMVVQVAMTWMGLVVFGIEGVAIAYFLLYIFALGVILLIARHLTGFAWSSESKRLLLLLLPVVAVTFIATQLMSLWPSTIFGVIATAICSVLCLRGLVSRVGYEHRIVKTALRIPGVSMLLLSGK